MIHPVPPGDSYRPNNNETAIDAYFDEAERLGLGVMYDMRHSTFPPALPVISFRLIDKASRTSPWSDHRLKNSDLVKAYWSGTPATNPMVPSLP